MEFHFGTKRTEPVVFMQYFVFRNSQREYISSFQPTNHINVSDSNNEDPNKFEEEISWLLTT